MGYVRQENRLFYQFLYGYFLRSIIGIMPAFWAFLRASVQSILGECQWHNLSGPTDTRELVWKQMRATRRLQTRFFSSALPFTRFSIDAPRIEAPLPFFPRTHSEDGVSEAAKAVGRERPEMRRSQDLDGS